VPWRSKYIAPRRHPLALSAYGLICSLGVLFIFHVFQSDAIDTLLGSSFWRHVWEWLLTVGGGIALIGAMWQGDLEDGLWMERLGSSTSMLGLLVYAGAVTSIAGFNVSTWLLLGVLALGCLWRSLQISKELWRVRRLKRDFMNGPPS
jgi:hypothetical protein